jgi:hypothetical protein
MLKRAVLAAVFVLIAVGVALSAAPFRAQFALNQECCQLPFTRNVVVTANELLGRVTYPSQIGQDKWVLETMFPGVTDGYFLDVGSGHGTFHSTPWRSNVAGGRASASTRSPRTWRRALARCSRRLSGACRAK